MSVYDRITAALAALSSPTPKQAKLALSRFGVRDVVASYIAQGGGGGSQTVYAVGPVTITVADVLAAPGSVAAYGADAGLGVTAATPGIGGNAIAVYFAPVPNTVTFSAEVDGTTITVHPIADSGGVITQNPSSIAGDLNFIPAAAALATFAGTGSDPYTGGDIYLDGGTSRLVLAQLAAGAIVWDVQEFFPETFDAGTVFTARIGVGNAPVYYGGEPDPTASADDTGSEGVAVAQADSGFTTTRRLRLTEDGDLTLHATCEAGTVPSQGSMIFAAEIVAAL